MEYYIYVSHMDIYIIYIYDRTEGISRSILNLAIKGRRNSLKYQ
jgi:hypothetical protein